MKSRPAWPNCATRWNGGILQTCPDTHINGDTTHRLPNTTNISFKFIEGESILLLMDEFGICASSGSACTSGTPEPSHVVMAMKVDPMAMHGSIRFSLSRYNTAADVEQTTEAVTPHCPTTARDVAFCEVSTNKTKHQLRLYVGRRK